MGSEYGLPPPGRGWPAGGRSSTRKVRAGRRSIEITDPERVIFPEAGTTKAGLVEYYRRIGREMLPHVRGRPLVVESFPDGVEGEGLLWSEPPEWFPDWVERFRAGREPGAATYMVCNRAPAFVYLVEHGMVTPHHWSSRVERPSHPDRMTFDIDPRDPADFDAVRDAAETLRAVLERLSLAAFPMTTGLRGIHVVVPLTGRDSFDSVRRFARTVVEMAAADAPGRVAPEPAAKSGGAGPNGGAAIAVARNGYARTSVAPYAVRGRADAPVATPFVWADLDKIEPGQFTVTNMFSRLAAREDPWRDIKRLARSLSRARRPL